MRTKLMTNREISTEQPDGSLMLRSVAMPADTNANGDIFGGWLLSEMDLAGGLAAKETCHSRTVTVAIDAIAFHQPVYVGDVVCCYARIERVGTTSMLVLVQAWVMRGGYDKSRAKVTEGVFTFVSIDEYGKPRPVSE